MGDNCGAFVRTRLMLGAAVLLVIVVAIGAALLFLQVFAGHGSSLGIEVGYDGTTLRIHHTGGVALAPGDYRVLVDGKDLTDSVRLENATGNFVAGRTLSLTVSVPVQGVVIQYKGDEGADPSIAQRYAEEFVPTGRADPWAMPFPPQPTSTPHAPEVPPKEYAFPPAPTPLPLAEEPRPGLIYVAAANSSPLPSSTVLQCDGAGDDVEINDALQRAGTVILLEGTFNLSRRLMVPHHTTLMGQEKARTVLEVENGTDPYQPIEIASPYVTVRDLRLQGQGFIRISASHVRVRNVTATSTTSDGRRLPSGGNGMFFVWADRGDIEDIEFYACTAYDCSTHGFNMNQDFSDQVPRTIRSTRFINCYAALCGYGEAGDSRSAWITGFDLQESQDLVDCLVVNSIAESNWESGFHIEPGARLDAAGSEIGPRTRSDGIVFENCTSKNNGWRNTDPGRFFMSGFYVHRNANLTNCSSINNRNAGFYVQSGENVRFDGCSDQGSTYGWLIGKSSREIVLDDCRSDQARVWALWAAFSSQLTVTDFTQVGAGSARGVQSMLGWYKDDAQYGRPVTNSSFEIAASGPEGTTPITREGSGNRYQVRPFLA